TAVVRCGNEAAAAVARSLWSPPLKLDTFRKDPLWLSRARGIPSLKLARRLGRGYRRLLHQRYPDCDFSRSGLGTLPERELLLQLALLGFPGPEGEPAAALRPFVQWQPFVEAHRELPGEMARLRDLWLRVQQIDRLADIV